MNSVLKKFLFSIILLYTLSGKSKGLETVALHIQVYNQGICIPMMESNFYSTSRYQKAKMVFQSGSYYSTIYAYVNSLDSGDLKPRANHELQSCSLQFKPTLKYELVVLRYDGYNRIEADTMRIRIDKLTNDAQIILRFKKGKFKLKKSKYFKKLIMNTTPDFRSVERKAFKNKLKIDSTAYFTNGRIKANYYVVSPNFPLIYVQEFDSANTNTYSRGYHLLSNYKKQTIPVVKPLRPNNAGTKYGYWEYFENGLRTKHEIWASILQQKFEWYPSGQLKSATHFAFYNKEAKHIRYLENGAIKEAFYAQTKTVISFLKSYAYSSRGDVILINTYYSSNGISKQGLQKRELFYPSGALKMEENFVGTYTITYYNEDGTKRKN